MQTALNLCSGRLWSLSQRKASKKPHSVPKAVRASPNHITHHTQHTHTKKRKESQPNPRNKQKQQTCMLQYIPFHSITSRGMTSCSCTKPQLLEPQLHTGQPMKFISGSLWSPVWGPYWPAYDVHIREPMRSSMRSILASLWSPWAMRFSMRSILASLWSSY